MEEPNEIPTAGSRTEHSHVLREDWRANRATIVFEGLAGSRAEYDLVGIDATPHLELNSSENLGFAPKDYANLAAYVMPCKYPCKSEALDLKFPSGNGWKTITVTLTW
jgi:hypothetical protein